MYRTMINVWPVEGTEDENYMKHFRMSKRTFDYILMVIEVRLSPTSDPRVCNEALEAQVLFINCGILLHAAKHHAV